MYRPLSPANLTSLMDAMISLKKLRSAVSSVISNILLCSSHNARCRMSPNLMHPLELEYMNKLHCCG